MEFNILLMHCQFQSTSSYTSLLIPVLALIVSIIALQTNANFSKKNIRLSIQQLLFKTIAEKVKDCNSIWDQETKRVNEPYINTVSELIITIECIENSFDLFSSNYEEVREKEDEYYKQFWNQLRTSLRQWIEDDASNTAHLIKDDTYIVQIKTIKSKFKINI